MCTKYLCSLCINEEIPQTNKRETHSLQNYRLLVTACAKVSKLQSKHFDNLPLNLRYGKEVNFRDSWVTRHHREHHKDPDLEENPFPSECAKHTN